VLESLAEFTDHYDMQGQTDGDANELTSVNQNGDESARENSDESTTAEAAGGSRSRGERAITRFSQTSMLPKQNFTELSESVR
jgi:hypothetical protein